MKLVDEINNILELRRVSKAINLEWKNQKLEIYQSNKLLVAFKEKDAIVLRDFINKHIE